MNKYIFSNTRIFDKGTPIWQLLNTNKGYFRGKDGKKYLGDRSRGKSWLA